MYELFPSFSLDFEIYFKVIIWLKDCVFLPLRSIGFASDVCGWGTGFYSSLSFLSTLHMNIIILTLKYETKLLEITKDCFTFKDFSSEKNDQSPTYVL